MAKNLVDLLWRGHAAAPPPRRRGPQSRRSTDDVLRRSIDLADVGGLDAVTIRAVAESLDLTTMSIYTYVNSRADLLVLMADEMNARMTVTPETGATWRHRLRILAEDNLRLLLAHEWLLEIDDPRLALGPGTIAKYDRELHAFDGTGITDVDRDAALAFVLDFVRAAAARMRTGAAPEEFGEYWSDAAPRLATYLGDDFPLAQAVGRAAGESMGGPYDPGTAWEFGLERVIDGLAPALSGPTTD